MAVSVQAKRKQTLSYKITHAISLTIKILLPVVLFVGIFAVSAYFSKQNILLLNQKKVYETQIIELQKKLVTISKNIEGVIIGSEVIK
ncbi:MAG: hypothetical protein H0Z24_00765 [Thermosipho sp. (in: Bacteria)]|nr:hypothetical protein [Thermosipho sp. (in: thermotogales)]